KSHHYGLVLAGAQPLYIDAFPLSQYSMYGSLAIKPIKQALLQLKREGKLDRAKLLVLTNCTFDGHVANVKRTMLECLAIKPDLIFLWDEAWFGFARFSPFLRRRTELEGYELVGRATQLAIEIRREINHHPLIGKYFRAATPADMIPAAYRQSGISDYAADGWSVTDTIRALDDDEFFLDPTRV